MISEKEKKAISKYMKDGENEFHDFIKRHMDNYFSIHDYDDIKVLFHLTSLVNQLIGVTSLLSIKMIREDLTQEQKKESVCEFLDIYIKYIGDMKVSVIDKMCRQEVR